MPTVPEASVPVNYTSEYPLWSVDIERSLIDDSLFATIYCSSSDCEYSEKLFFKGKSQKCPKCKSSLSVGNTNKRNAVVGNKTECFALCLLDKVVQRLKTDLKQPLYAKGGVICPELGFKNRSLADLAILNRDSNGAVTADAIECLFEVKMSFIWNWDSKNISRPIADYDSHSGRPSIYRTDSILKAIGKAAITRSYRGSERIPFIVLGNTPPPKSYRANIDSTVTSGLIQKWVSVTPHPLVVCPNDESGQRNPKRTPGFLRIDHISELCNLMEVILDRPYRHMSAMVDVEKLGQVIKALNLGSSPEQVGNQFLEMLPDASASTIM